MPPKAGRPSDEEVGFTASRHNIRRKGGSVSNRKRWERRLPGQSHTGVNIARPEGPSEKGKEPPSETVRKRHFFSRPGGGGVNYMKGGGNRSQGGRSLNPWRARGEEGAAGELGSGTPTLTQQALCVPGSPTQERRTTRHWGVG